MRTVLIIGGGAAGLTAALRLCAHDYAVTLLEERSDVGGRLISPGAPQTGRMPPDTMPPVIVGYQRSLLSLLEHLGTLHHLRSCGRRSFEWVLPGGRTVSLARPWMPGRLATVLGIALFRGLAVADRRRLLSWIERTWEQDPPLPADLESHTADDWLIAIGQSDPARDHIWKPLARFLVGNDITVISAAVLVEVLSRCFLSSRQQALLTFPSHGFDDLLLNPARRALERAGAVIRLDEPVEQFRSDAHQITGIQLKTGGVLTADCYISALPHWRLTPLLSERTLTRFSYFQQITKLTDSPALTVHLCADAQVMAPRLRLLANRHFHWLVSRSDEQNGPRRTIISLVATGRPDLLDRPDDELLELALAEIAAAAPDMPVRPADYRIIREPRAFLTAAPGTGLLRPLAQSPLSNLFLAGDWTDTGLPATVESAVASGELCAQAILAGSDRF
jgi:squalene-associated FAD-dependent desaturase